MNIFNSKKIWIACLAFGAMTFSSCEDFLDRQEDEKLTFDKIWESSNKITIPHTETKVVSNVGNDLCHS